MKNKLSWVGLAAMGLLFVGAAVMAVRELLSEFGLWSLIGGVVAALCGTKWFFAEIRLEQLEEEVARLRAGEELRNRQEQKRR